MTANTKVTAPSGTAAPQRSTSNSPLARIAQRLMVDPSALERTVKSTCFPNGGKEATNEQFAAFLIVADVYDLNPITKEIYAFPGKGGGIVPIVSVDGWIKMMNREANFDGIEFKDELDGDGKLVSITATIYRKDRSHPIVVTEYMAECWRNTGHWLTHPRRALRHKALIQGNRVAFGFAGIYDQDEAERIVEAQATVRVVDASAKSLDELTNRLEAAPPPRVVDAEPAKPAAPAVDMGTLEPIDDPFAPKE